MVEQKHIPGKPMYSTGDVVSFQLIFDEQPESFEGTIEIVDKWGAWEIDNPREPSYDIMVENWRGSGQPMFVKHIRESLLRRKSCESEKE